MRYRYIKTDMERLCRGCLNVKYGIKLYPEDCVYTVYPRLCCRCGEVKNIVENISVKKKLSLWFK